MENIDNIQVFDLEQPCRRRRLIDRHRLSPHGGPVLEDISDVENEDSDGSCTDETPALVAFRLSYLSFVTSALFMVDLD